MELLGIEPLEERARRLAALLTLSRRQRGAGRTHLRRLDDHARVLRQVYTVLAEDARMGEPSSPAAEWLLDNFHIISAAVRDVHHDLPPSFYKKLPKIAADESAGEARVFVMALELIRRSAGYLDAQRLLRFVSAFQSIAPLTMGELSAADARTRRHRRRPQEEAGRCAECYWRDRRGCHPLGRAASGGRAGVHVEFDRQPAPGLDLRLE
jgi:cyclic beta-1,2-glucan synthetase